MVTGRPKAQLILDEAERAQLASMARSRSLSAALVLRARIVLACEVEPSNRKVAARLRLNAATVGKWRKRFVQQRISGCTTSFVLAHRVASTMSASRC